MHPMISVRLQHALVFSELKISGKDGTQAVARYASHCKHSLHVPIFRLYNHSITNRSHILELCTVLNVRYTMRLS